jgi:hypothetical protein
MSAASRSTSAFEDLAGPDVRVFPAHAARHAQVNSRAVLSRPGMQCLL